MKLHASRILCGDATLALLQHSPGLLKKGLRLARLQSGIEAMAIRTIDRHKAGRPINF